MKATYNKKSATNADPEASRQSASPRSEQKRKFVIEVPDLDDEIPRLMPGKRRRLSAQPTRQSAAPPAVEPASVFASTSANEEVLSTIDSDLLAVPAISNDIEADSAAEGSQSSSPKKGKIKMIDRMNGRPTSRRSQTPDASSSSKYLLTVTSLTHNVLQTIALLARPSPILQLQAETVYLVQLLRQI